MHSSEAALWDTVDALYSAAIHPAEWDGALAKLARLCDAEVAGVHVDTRGLTAHCATARWHGFDPSFTRAYVEHYWREDPWWTTLTRDCMAGAVGFGEGLVARRTLERSAFHNELALRHGLDDLVAGLLAKNDDEQIVFGIMGRRGLRFNEGHRRTAERVVPHLGRAVTIGKRLMRAAGDDQRPLLEERLRARYHLTEAEARVAAHVGRGLSPKESAAALGTSWNTVRHQLRRVFAKTHTGRQAELARLVHALESGTRTDEQRRTMLAPSADEYLRRRYRLTPAEMRVAFHIARGLSAKETAAQLGSRWNTVRAQLRQIYAKTGASGQVELTRLMALLEA